MVRGSTNSSRLPPPDVTGVQAERWMETIVTPSTDEVNRLIGHPVGA